MRNAPTIQYKASLLINYPLKQGLKRYSMLTPTTWSEPSN